MTQPVNLNPHAVSRPAGGNSVTSSSQWRELTTQILTPFTGVAAPKIGANPNLVELIRYQMLVGQAQIKIELVSRVAESVLSSLRRLQQG